MAARAAQRNPCLKNMMNDEVKRDEAVKKEEALKREEAERKQPCTGTMPVVNVAGVRPDRYDGKGDCSR